MMFILISFRLTQLTNTHGVIKGGTMAEKTTKVKKVCECKNCGNEAEMLVTCTMTALEEDTDKAGSKDQAHAHQIKGSATCSHCGNEADMWVDLP